MCAHKEVEFVMIVKSPTCFLFSYLQDDLLAELEELEQEELEADLLEVGEPSKPLDIADPLDELPEVRKYHTCCF